MATHLLLLLLPLIATINTAIATATAVTLPNCPGSCGNVTVPYPFGTEEGCHLPGFKLSCTSSGHLLLAGTFYSATAISLSAGTVLVDGSIARDCYKPLDLAADVPVVSFNVTGLPYTISSERNRFTALGCDTLAISSDRGTDGFVTGCIALCGGADRDAIPNGTCSGIGCCQTRVPAGMKVLTTALSAFRNHTTTWKISQCSYAFVVDEDGFEFDVSQLGEFYRRSTIPMVLDWAVGEETCDVAVPSRDYVCGRNTFCLNSTNGGGYRCSCNAGYDGNPYLTDGCQDIDECEDASTNPCSDICTNTLGSYTCSCPKGTTGDGKKQGSGCIKKSSRFPLVQLILGIGLGLIFVIVIISWAYWATKKRTMMILQEEFFKQNGGLLLRQRIASTSASAVTAPTPKIFTAKELEAATNRYSPSCVLGSGTYGTVYKGVLSDGSTVAIKKSNVVDPSQTEQFVNEVLILSQVVHPNVVRLVGCCLETEVPLLVYEFVPNGTLSVHLGGRRLSWSMRLRIAAETASALAHLHGATSRPIIHRDVKSANILLDGEFTAKVADFGASRLIPMGKKEVLTMVQGTLGYLDPEYFQTGYLSDKSDVYSFGVVVAELLTGEAAVAGERVLATWFLRAVEEGRLMGVVEERVRNEGRRKQVEAVAEMVGRCLRLKGEERPTMAEVAAELERWQRWTVDRRHRSPVVEGEMGEAESSRYYSIVHVRDDEV